MVSSQPVTGASASREAMLNDVRYGGNIKMLCAACECKTRTASRACGCRRFSQLSTAIGFIAVRWHSSTQHLGQVPYSRQPCNTNLALPSTCTICSNVSHDS